MPPQICYLTCIALLLKHDICVVTRGAGEETWGNIVYHFGWTLQFKNKNSSAARSVCLKGGFSGKRLLFWNLAADPSYPAAQCLKTEGEHDTYKCPTLVASGYSNELHVFSIVLSDYTLKKLETAQAFFDDTLHV